MVMSVKRSAVHGHEALDELWRKVIDLFVPWIQPLDNSGQILSPWIDTDEETAATMATYWAEAINTLQQNFEELVPSPDQYPVNRLLI